eukprot:TRINITY_DN3247_c0_g1_i1.p1 TRINITY_DN3247_c0_g1~~TRINITY_DN3247_c0_g1_i1.p1  ORF type:complete len:398 (+),score=81.51 TRINITY_DN3247_c0_g1_i1:135-1196(+)
MEYGNGDFYEGTWAVGVKHGAGVMMEIASGERYEGEWEHGQRHGKGRLDFSDDYMGRLFYDGEWRQGKRHGFGFCQFVGKSYYRGQWKDDKYDGNGELSSDNGNVFKGEFISGVKKYGEMLYANGDIYVGEFQDQRRHGQGRFQWSDGHIYSGEWVKGRAHGIGVMQFPNEEKFAGGFVEDQWGFGHGTYQYRDGAKYEGDWNVGKRHGHGIYFYLNGNKFIGDWADDFQHGRGKMEYAVDAEGRTLVPAEVYEGEWNHGEVVGKGSSLMLAALKLGKMRVQTAMEEAKMEIERLKKASVNSKTVCRVCFDNQINTIFLECAHCVCCHHCAFSQKNCPKCKKKITRCVRTYTT